MREEERASLTKLGRVATAAALLLIGCGLAAAGSPPPAAAPIDRAALAGRVREEFLHAWRAYE